MWLTPAELQGFPFQTRPVPQPGNTKHSLRSLPRYSPTTKASVNEYGAQWQNPATEALLGASSYDQLQA